MENSVNPLVRRRSRLILAFFGALVFVLSPWVVVAQYNTAEIEGVVKDEKGGLLF